MVRGRSRPLPPTSTSSTSYAAIAAFATAAVGMMDDLVDNEEKNHQVSQLALESTVEDLKVWQNISRTYSYGETNSIKAILFFLKRLEADIKYLLYIMFFRTAEIPNIYLCNMLEITLFKESFNNYMD